MEMQENTGCNPSPFPSPFRAWLAVVKVAAEVPRTQRPSLCRSTSVVAEQAPSPCCPSSISCEHLSHVLRTKLPGRPNPPSPREHWQETLCIYIYCVYTYTVFICVCSTVHGLPSGSFGNTIKQNPCPCKDAEHMGHDSYITPVLPSKRNRWPLTEGH